MNDAARFVRRRWPALALAASLVLNGFLIGVLATDYARPHWSRSQGQRAFGYELRRLERRLPDVAMERIRAELKPLEPAMQRRFESLRAARDDIYRMAAAPTPDRPAIDARLAALRSEAIEMQAELHRVIYDAVLKLPAEQRAGLTQGRRKD